MFLWLDTFYVLVSDRLERFDSIANTDTAGYADGAGFNYTPVRASVFAKMIAGLPISDFGNFTFVDIGCGKGRPLLLASRLGFRKVVGVELSSKLAEIARRNLECFQPADRKTHDAQVLTADARTFPLPDGDLFLFLFQPFDAATLAATLDRVARLISERPRRCVVLYAYGRMHPIFESRPAFRPIASAPTGGRPSSMGWTLFDLLPS
jgi:SAM-dependent methyltransferase